MIRRRRAFAAAALALGLLASLVLLEIFFRLYDPIGFRVRGDEIVLPRGEVVRIDNDTWPKLDPVIVHSKNSLGFRGPEPPKFFDRALTVVVAGGSTTECFYLADGHDWPAALGRQLEPHFESLWVNNAGLDGHSTFGHRVLLANHLERLRPKVIVYLLGVNDMGLEGPRPHDRRQQRTAGPGSDGFGSWLGRRSALGAFLLNLKRYEAAVRKGLVHPESFDLATTPEAPPAEDALDVRLKADEEARRGFRQRLGLLVEETLAAGILPVLITQPALFGPGRDPATGIEMAPLEYRGWSAADAWARLEGYNGVTRDLGTEAGVPVIDLAAELDKDSRYFYDWVHYTNEGAESVAEIIARDLCPVLVERFPDYLDEPCSSPEEAASAKGAASTAGS